MLVQGLLAFKEVYVQNVEAEGCWFYFAQAVVRKGKKTDLSSAFADDEEAHCITCLPDLSPSDIDTIITIELETPTTIQFLCPRP